MIIHAPLPIGHVKVELEWGEALHLLHPKTIIAYKGSPKQREDRFLDLAGMYRKRKWIKSRLAGPVEFIISLPLGSALETVDIAADSDLLFDFRHVLFFTEGLAMKSRIQKIKNIWITQELVRMRFSGPGKLGLLTLGSIATLQLDTVQPLYVETGALVAYPESAKIKLSVYGNKLASQHMKVQWEITGSGPVLIQTGSSDPALSKQLQGDGLIKRILREVLPFGNIYIK